MNEKGNTITPVKRLREENNNADKNEITEKSELHKNKRVKKRS